MAAGRGERLRLGFGLRLAGDALAGVFFMVWLTQSIWLLVLLWRRSDPFDDLRWQDSLRG